MFSSCLMMRKAQGLEAITKMQARLDNCLVLGTLYWMPRGVLSSLIWAQYEISWASYLYHSLAHRKSPGYLFTCIFHELIWNVLGIFLTYLWWVFFFFFLFLVSQETPPFKLRESIHCTNYLENPRGLGCQVSQLRLNCIQFVVLI